MPHAFYLGVDAREETAGITVLSKETDGQDDTTVHLNQAQFIEEAPEALADRLQAFVSERPYIGRTTLVVNTATERGAAVHEALGALGLDAVDVTLTDATTHTTGDENAMSVVLGIEEALESLATLHQDGALTLDGLNTEAASDLARSLQRYLDDQVTNDAPDGPTSYSAALTSASLAGWMASERTFDPTERLKTDMRSGA
ncbi:hypothetical protein [Salisaeta longa]|uniref:hypothetical protein n=1 Tax=Salisaeta longa TaxID=503170 RepID=UPI0003B4E4E1|nr:hypothetical protein [Salisaeta longa]